MHYLAGVFLLAVCALSAGGRLPAAIAVLYVAASAATSIAYWIDKSAAQTNTWRTPETTLHLLSLIGGWPGALIAQTLLHHKSRKLSFQLVFWTTVALNCAALVVLVDGPLVWWPPRS
jgi:uncharacterized membrane protein YsdA (DUF1294 family)